MTKKIAVKPRRCQHDELGYERTSDGYFCPRCAEGVCPECRKLWQSTGTVDPETGDFEEAPACKCHEPVILPYQTR